MVQIEGSSPIGGMPEFEARLCQKWRGAVWVAGMDTFLDASNVHCEAHNPKMSTPVLGRPSAYLD